MRVRYNGHRIPGDPERSLTVGSEYLAIEVKEYGIVILDEGLQPLTLYADEVDVVNPCTDTHQPCGNEWLGTDARDYFKDSVYQSARSLDEAIEIRGQLHEIRTSAPQDFDAAPKDGCHRLGQVEIWSSSLIGGGMTEYAYALAADSVHVGDRLLVVYEGAPTERPDISFVDQDGTVLPFSPYYDFDAQALEGARPYTLFEKQVVCRVKEIRRSVGTCAPHAPECIWTVTDFITDLLVEDSPTR